jgi:hypothetical protein
VVEDRRQGEDLRLTVTRSSNPNAGPYGGAVVASGGPLCRYDGLDTARL